MTDDVADVVIDAISDVMIDAELELEDARDLLMYLLSHTLQQMAPEYNAEFAERMGLALAEGYHACCSADEVNANITFQ